MWEVGLEGVEAYVLRMKNNVMKFIAARPILDLCEETVHMPVTGVSKRW